MTLHVGRRNPTTLRPHPLNDEIYGDRADVELVESIRERGLLNPLLLAADGATIISGHRRWAAVQALGLDDVPVIINLALVDDLDIEEALIAANRQRTKTNEQIAREYKHLARILNERQSRQGSRTDLTSVTIVTEVPPTRQAADMLGVSHQTANKAVRVVEAIDSAEPDEAERLRSTLNKSVNGAYKLVKQQRQTPAPPPRQSNVITLAEWNNGQRWHGDAATTGMNRVNENIEWAAWSWNPVTGCLHNCAYCYARDIANRFYAQKFEPSFVPERLSQPAQTTPIEPRWDGDTGHRNVFTCSMADLFGKWVPQEWIEAVIKVAVDNPQWTFLYLTKFPVRMAEFSYPQNVWLGTSVDRQHAVQRAESAFTKIKASGFQGVCWLSCEPMLERLTFGSLDMFDWVVMGGSSKSTQTAQYVPPFDDIVHLHNQARASGCMVYQKTNLLPGIGTAQRLREYP